MTDTTLTWRKSSYSGTQSECVEVAWRKSSYSGSNSTCVEVARDAAILLRNSNAPDAGTLAVAPADFGTLLAGCRSGHLDDLTC
jgi:hypothetical protein